MNSRLSWVALGPRIAVYQMKAVLCMTADQDDPCPLMWVKCEELNVSKSRPLYPDVRTSTGQADTSQKVVAMTLRRTSCCKRRLIWPL